jgi:hypothetical protein
MELEWKLTRSGPFPNGIRNAIANLRAALVIREAEALQDTESLVSSVQVAEEVVKGAESGDERGEESHRKVCSAALTFDWAEAVDASISATQVVDGEPTPLTNIDTSGDVPPIAHVEATPIVSVENASINPNTIATPPRDLSGLRSGTPNPWESLRHHRNGRYSPPRQFARPRWRPLIYPVDANIHTASIPKPPTPIPIRIFETIRHPLGIGPTKPVIRVPVSTAMDAVVHPTQYTPQPIVKSKPILPQRQSNVTI